MTMQWTPDLSIGVEEIDDQHKELIRRLNALGEAMMKGLGKDEIGSLLDFLESYVVVHFDTEDRHMVRTGYPSLEAHRERHRELIADLGRFRSGFDLAGADLSLVLALDVRLVEWLRTHICGTDKQLGAFLRAKG